MTAICSAELVAVVVRSDSVFRATGIGVHPHDATVRWVPLTDHCGRVPPAVQPSLAVTRLKSGRRSLTSLVYDNTT